MLFVIHVENLALSLINSQRQSQKKAVSPPLSSKKRIKCVKDATFVGHCVSVPNVSNAPNVVHIQPVGELSTGILADLVPSGSKSEGSFDLEGRLCDSIQDQNSSSTGSIDNQWVCNPSGTATHRSFACTDPKIGSRDCKGSTLSSLFQRTVYSTKVQPQMVSHCGSQFSEQNCSCKNIPKWKPQRPSGSLCNKGNG